jgi:hypothetical protein
MTDVGKILMITGLAIAILGAVLWLIGHSGLPLGRLPGDISIDRPHFKFYFPIVTCLLISALLTLIIWLLHRR